MRRTWMWVLAAIGCDDPLTDKGSVPPTETLDCGAEEPVVAWVDGDGDGFGGASDGLVCALGDGRVAVGGDCDDQQPTVFPGGTEVCDPFDNDCDGEINDGLPRDTWYRDADGDGWGDDDASDEGCASLGEGWSTERGDCDDFDPARNPDAEERCNGLDDDCDGDEDDEDDDVDPATLTTVWRDSDRDGWGDDARPSQGFCVAPAEGATRAGDCDDGEARYHPEANEICNFEDDDCDGFVDDDDPSIDRSSQSDYFVDLDGDGLGDASSLTPACRPGPGVVENGDDCDDGDANATVVMDWYLDGDGDGVGDGVVVARQCHAPPGGRPETAGIDCDDADEERFPGHREVCEDGFDQDCNGSDLACATWMYTVSEYNDTLERVDVDTLTWEVIGPLNTWFDFGDLAYDEAAGTMYMVDGRASLALYTVDLTTGAATMVGIHGVWDLFGLVVDGNTGRLYGATFGGNPYGGWAAFYELDKTTGAATYIGDPGATIDSMTWDGARGQIIGVSAGYGTFYAIDPATGAGTLLGGAGFVDNGGVAWDPVDDDYWYIDWGGRLYQYDPLNLGVQNVVQTYMNSHAGLAYVPDPPN